MRSVDERPVAHGGEGSRRRRLAAVDRDGFIQRHELWGEEQYAAAEQMQRVVDELGIERVRVSFVDQHGILRGKTVTLQALAEALRDRVRAPSSLLLKDTSGHSVFPVFAADVGLGVSGFSGAGNMVLVPDPVTFRPLPWSPGTALMLCDLRFPSGEPVPFCTRSLLRGVLSDLQARGYRLAIGAELEFHVFKADGPPAGVDHGAAHEPPGLPVAHEPSGLPTVNPTTAGGQLMHDDALDQLDELVCKLHHGLTQLDLPLRSIELEFGASQLEVTLGARDALAGADEVALCRAAIRQLCRRAGYLATFMARPAGSRGASTGWHLHQQLRDRVGRSAFTPPEGTQSADSVAPGSASVCDILSPVGGWYLGGLLAHAPAAAVFTTPTVNGYKRFRPMSLAPDRINWGIDNRGAMIRAIGGPGIESTRLENRSGEPAANPYLYVASQVVCGLDGIARRLDPGPPAEEPYRLTAPRLPRSLGEALGALAADRLFADALGQEVVAWYAALKQAEFERYLCHVSDWEQQEYLTLL